MNPKGSFNILKRSAVEVSGRQAPRLTDQAKRPFGSGSRTGSLKEKVLSAKPLPDRWK